MGARARAFGKRAFVPTLTEAPPPPPPLRRPYDAPPLLMRDDRTVVNSSMMDRRDTPTKPPSPEYSAALRLAPVNTFRRRNIISCQGGGGSGEGA